MIRWSVFPVVVSQASSSPARDVWPSLLWFGAILLGGLLVMLTVRTMLRRGSRTDRLFGSTFSLDELRGMRDRGELTIDEYEALRRKVIAAATASPGKTPGKAPGS